MSKALDEAWPERPEWLDMYTDILQGSQLGPNDGWFRRAKAQSRFGWDATRARYDRDGDGKIARDEWSGTAADFARLDRDHDDTLTRDDFDFTPHALTPSPGMMLFFRADSDGNGKVTREEFDALFKKWDAGNTGFLSLSDLQDALRSPTPPKNAKPNAGPSKETLIRGLFRQEIGSLQPGPALDEKAPDFTLKTNDGTRGNHPVEADRAEAGRVDLRQFHLRPISESGRQRRKALSQLQRPRDVRDGLRPRGPPDRRLVDGKQ